MIYMVTYTYTVKPVDKGLSSSQQLSKDAIASNHTNSHSLSFCVTVKMQTHVYISEF